MFGGIKEKISQGKEELSIKMNDTYVRSQSPSKLISVIANGNKEIIDIQIDAEIYENKEQFEDELIISINKAIEMARILYKDELNTVMKANMPNIPGLPDLDGLLD